VTYVEPAEPAVGEAYHEGGEVAGRPGEKCVEDPLFNTVHSLVKTQTKGQPTSIIQFK
jgi:hypothetical protein